MFTPRCIRTRPPPITTDAAWTALGPSPLPNGGGTIPVSGRVTTVVVDPTNSSKVYLGTAQGGVWRSLVLQLAADQVIAYSDALRS